LIGWRSIAPGASIAVAFAAIPIEPAARPGGGKIASRAAS
jgi:hypothetical protein